MNDDLDDEWFECSDTYCIHWSAIYDCDVICTYCKHTCSYHFDDGCNVPDCVCTGWSD